MGGDCSGECAARTNWCQRVPDKHNEDICHNVSLKTRNIITEMKKLVNENYNTVLCEQWDTQSTLNNTSGPHRFGVIQPDKQNQELIGSRLIGRCDCDKRNGLQDDCQRWNCRGAPECQTQPLPSCTPFLGYPSNRKVPAFNPNTNLPRIQNNGPDECEKCRCRTAEM